jgi:putative FmdB family regulatory protein
MPTYDYVCQACGLSVEVMHAVHAEGPSTCGACGGRLRKALSTPAIVFKGSGWAKVDARAKKASRSTPDKAAPATPAEGNGPLSDKPAPAPAAGGADDAGSSSTSSSRGD